MSDQIDWDTVEAVSGFKICQVTRDALEAELRESCLEVVLAMDREAPTAAGSNIAMDYDRSTAADDVAQAAPYAFEGEVPCAVELDPL